MALGKTHTPEQIVSLLRRTEVAVANGKTTPQRAGKSHATDKFQCAKSRLNF
jgi:hypothetical protein